MASPKNVLVTAASGHIGSDLVPALLATGSAKLILPTSNAKRLQSQLPPTSNPSNTIIPEGSIKDPSWIESLLTAHAVDTVFLCLTGLDEVLTTFNFLDAMRRAGTVRHLVYLSACGDFTSSEAVKRLFATCSAAHVLEKSTMETKLLHGGYAWKTTVLGPTLFCTNDEMYGKAALLREGVFNVPYGEAGVSRVSMKDIALAATNLIMHPEHQYAGTKVMLGSLKQYSGKETAALWGKALGMEVKMVKSDEDGFEEFEAGMVARGAEKVWARDMKLMYHYFAIEGFGMSQEAWDVQCEVLGREPEDYAEWVMRTGREWLSQEGKGV